MKMHVLQLGPYPPPVGGVSRNMLAIRDELVRQGHSWSIIATTKSTEIKSELDVYHPDSPLELIKQIRELKFDVLHLNVGGEITGRVIGLAFICSIIGKGKCVLTVHSGAYPQTDKAKSARPNSIRGMIFRRFSRLIGVNDAIADVFKRYGVSDDKIRVILPYSLSTPDPEVRVPPELKDFYDRHSPVLVAVGGLEKDYDPLFQIAAMKEILAKFPNAGLMIVGDGSMKQNVSDAVDASGYVDNICLAGNVEHAVTLHLINDAGVLLRTTLFDGDAISVREALHLNTAVIATDNGMRPEGVELIESGDREGLAAAVKKAIAKGKSDALKQENGNENIAAVVELYKELL